MGAERFLDTSDAGLARARVEVIPWPPALGRYEREARVLLGLVPAL
jgi:hypothetical protein